LNKRPVAIDLFSGCGGMSLGLEAAGFDVAVSVEFDAVHALVHHYNFPYGKTICSDIGKISSNDIYRALEENGYKKDVDLIAGGPPCQGFSFIGKRQYDDPRNSLVYEYLRVISEVRPKYFIFENVPGIASGLHREFLDSLISSFEELGYEITKPIRVLDASEYGAPQKRKRLILIGSRGDVPKAEYPQPSYNKDADSYVDLFSKKMRPFNLVGDAIGDLENLSVYTGADEGVASDQLDYTNARSKYNLRPADVYSLCHRRDTDGFVYGHVGSIHTELSVERFKNAQRGLVEEKSRFFKLSEDGLCNTLRAGTNSDKGAYTAPRPIHYSVPRCISVREAARLHTFPDWFNFHKTIWHGFREIGNAVIPMLSRELGSSVRSALGVEVTDLPVMDLQAMPKDLLSMNMTQASEYWGIANDIIPKRKRL
jgi:DNA (cytosine-5)-methyltransferase 1